MHAQRFIILAVAIVFLLNNCYSTYAQTPVTNNFILNGNFDQTNRNLTDDTFTTLFAGDDAISNWTIGPEGTGVAPGVDRIGGIWVSYSGNYSAELNYASLSQNVSLDGPLDYILSFAYAGNPSQEESLIRVKTMQVSVTSGNSSLLSQNFTFNVLGYTRQNPGWIYTQTRFTSLPGVNTYLVRFGSFTPSIAGPALDDVVLGLATAAAATPSPSPAAVSPSPVPSTCPVPSPCPVCPTLSPSLSATSTPSPTSSPCVSASPSASPSCCPKSSNDDGVIINFYFADILNGIN
eukprot:TRINITY_DN1554_c0_g1_i1.p1 TRINITY_DN1554_c0_g1~~TRINITY_DN1554_c0_g1_i1.p1  ORF type:complete len:292 (-),score=41.58 TRINITY_DN1554_c0_g1_i1:77-952(-)